MSHGERKNESLACVRIFKTSGVFLIFILMPKYTVRIECSISIGREAEVDN